MKKIILIVSVMLIVVLLVALLPKGIGDPIFADNAVEVNRYDEPLKYLEEKGIVNGFEDGKLHPERNLTRAEFAKILTKAYPDVAVQQRLYNFSDVSTSHWAFEFIQTAANAGWVKGFEDGSFGPEENVTFEQAITVICRILNLGGNDNDYPASYINAAVKNSITEGITAVVGEKITRNQMARLLVNAMDYETNLWKSEEGFDSDSKQVLESAGGGGGGGSAYIGVPSVSAGYSGDSMSDYGYVLDSNTEEYASVDENVFKNVVTSPLSTFSIDTDTASYSNMRRFILNNQKIPEGAIRTEELINYFDYERAVPEQNEPFGVKYTVAECPWNSDNALAMITISAQDMIEAQKSNIVFLIDVSGSMYSENKLPLVKQSLALLLDKLGEEDTISIVTYASGTGVLLDTTPVCEKKTILDALESLNAGGSTAGEAGINLAYKQAEKAKCDGNNRIIICTDGDFNVGGSGATNLGKLISQKRESGISLSVLGFGMGNYKDSAMEVLADKGNGNYAYIDNINEAKKVLVDEMSKTIYTVAKDVKIQVEFNPEKVSEYRLIGYENRVLNDEDFDNDQKDAGELGAGATVTVLYEIVPAHGGSESQLKYQKSYTTGSDELMSVKIRYKHPDGDESILEEYPIMPEYTEKTSDDFRFAAAVAELGMILNESEHKGTSTFDSVIELAEGAVGEDKYDLRNEFILLVGLLKYQAKAD